jgi:signal transduction histidine kinase
VYAWIRHHPVAADGLLGLVLLAGSAGQLGLASAGAAFAALAVNAALALAVALRRRETVPAFCAVAVIGIAQAIGGFSPDGQAPVSGLQPTVTDAAVVVLLYTLAAYQPRRTSLAGLVLCLAGSAIAISRWRFAHTSLNVLLLAVAALGATFVATWVLGDSTAYRHAYYRSLEDKLAAAERARDLETKRAQAVDESAARLRRIERDLHDGAQVRLTALAMSLGEIKETMERDPHGARALVAEAHQNAKRTLIELRDLARGIHPAVWIKVLIRRCGASRTAVRYRRGSTWSWPGGHRRRSRRSSTSAPPNWSPTPPSTAARARRGSWCGAGRRGYC